MSKSFYVETTFGKVLVVLHGKGQVMIAQKSGDKLNFRGDGFFANLYGRKIGNGFTHTNRPNVTKDFPKYNQHFTTLQEEKIVRELVEQVMPHLTFDVMKQADELAIQEAREQFIKDLDAAADKYNEMVQEAKNRLQRACAPLD